MRLKINITSHPTSSLTCDLFGKDPKLGAIILVQTSFMRARLRGASSIQVQGIGTVRKVATGFC